MAAKKTVKPVALASAATTPKAEAKKTETPAEVKTEVKAETKKAEAPAAVKTEVKAEKPASVKKETVKKETAKKETVKKAPVKKSPVKKEAKNAEIKSEVHVQFSGKSYTQEDLVKIAKDVWTYDLNGDLADLTSIELYVKPEEQTVYYVMNKEFTGSFAV